ncbi:MAG: LCP family protein [Hydrogenibacillus schlegelii]|uniref:LCP family protein n=1 Tax=Hydrogenibacillus schlegelii TaxID=1484 RepID=A0A947CV42_HYDSH|nr:LCP family protein [Hydrogenibacillus schlegelii]MBT9281705.1 LCP family protein [Hydrogenibacillus schlegelii]
MDVMDNRPAGGWWRRGWFWALVALVFAVVGGAGYAMWRIDHALDKMTAGEGNEADGVGSAEAVAERPPEKPFTVLLLGTDTRPDLGSLNTDVIMLAVVNPAERKITLLSIPRDTRVMIPGYGYAKINAAYAIGENRKARAERNGKPVTDTGPSLVKKTVSGYFGVPVDRYVLLDFVAFKEIIDALGGIDVDVERRLVYHDPTDGTVIDLSPGLQHLNGEQALGYVRHRHDDRGPKYYSSDFDRNRRQQIVIQKVADKVKSIQGVTRFFTLLDIVSDHVRTDFTKKEIRSLLSAFLGVGSEAITTIEAHPYGFYSAGGAYVAFPEEELKRIRETLWQALGLDPEKGMALIDPANDRQGGGDSSAGSKKAAPAKPAPAKPAPAQSAPSRKTPSSGAVGSTPEKSSGPSDEGALAAPPSSGGSASDSPPPDAVPSNEGTPEGDVSRQGGSPDVPLTPSDGTVPPAPPADGAPAPPEPAEGRP